jgi:hypothetical protein
MKTAVEFIEDYLKFKGLIIDKPNIPQVLVGIIKEAKEMEEQKIIDAYKKGRESGQTNYGYGNDVSSEQYYNETFNKDE